MKKDWIKFLDPIDHATSSLIYRLQHGGGHKNQALTKAIGTNNKQQLKVIDATCGLGNDAIVLAYFNCKVYAIEKNSTIASLTNHRLLKMKEHPFFASIINNISLFNGNCVDLIPSIIQEINCLPDVIYLDPMFNKKTTAKPNKLIQITQIILGKSKNNVNIKKDNLLQVSLEHAAKRVVVKRSKSCEYLENLKPNFVLSGKTNRFDVYLP